LPIAAFIGAFATLLLVYGIAKKAGASRITLVLSGVAISSLFAAGINTIAITHSDILRSLRDFQIGGFTGVTLRILLPAGIIILLGIFATRLLAGELDVLSLGEQTAFSLGLNVKLYRFIFLALATLLAGAAVSFAGLVGFVGLIVPHMVRIILRKQQGSLLCLSALMGASFLILSDTAARTLFAPFELPVGILVSFFGAPFFLWLLFRGKSHA
jgi:iron complex transport system permease protein